MRKKTRALALLLCLIAVFTLFCGCGGKAPASAPLPAEAPAVSTEPSLPPLVLLTDAPPAADAAAPDSEETPAPTSVPTPTPEPTAEPTATPLPEDGEYDSAEEVALYIHTYGHLPDNYISKKEAQKLGWPGGGLDDYAYGKCIGGDRFGNYEGLLPSASGRTYKECDIGTLHARSRGAKRIIFSNDGLIFYTDDHYESFTQLY